MQALKYEEEISGGVSGGNDAANVFSQLDRGENKSTRVSSLSTFLIDRASCNIELANFLYWYVVTSFCEICCSFLACCDKSHKTILLAIQVPEGGNTESNLRSKIPGGVCSISSKAKLCEGFQWVNYPL